VGTLEVTRVANIITRQFCSGHLPVLIVCKFMQIAHIVESGGKDSAGAWHLEPIFVDFETLDFRIERSRR
jgi:hypothetical protein